MTPSEAAQFVTPLFDLHPLMTFKLPCLKMMHHALFGPEGDPVGEVQGVTATAPENGASQSSTETGR
ncbi:hypothetical protein Ga0080574_TMP2808 [Salipiger abyssi]|uniref:Uncharacterized protein n=2 Tax=Salipiger abyssi TaxID=1250539 RepID=A0A1P8UUS3_9RHOB|nr:hypothetical protein Ga0080574_TMP2808 [Salipiger abyssi]